MPTSENLRAWGLMAACAALLGWAGLSDAEAIDYPALREASLERLADTLAEHLDLAKLMAAVG